MKTFIKFLCGTVLSLLFLFAFTSCFNIAHYVSFYCEGAKVTSPVIVRDGGKVSVPNINMEREGHEFVGWFDENGRPFDFENTIIYSHIRSGGSMGSIDLYKAIVDRLDEKTGKVRIWKGSDMPRKFSQVKGTNCFVTKPDTELKKAYKESQKNTCT